MYSFPIPPVRPKTRGVNDFHVNNSLLVLPFDLFLMLRGGRWLGVEFRCVTRTSKNAAPPRDQKLPAFMSSLASRLALRLVTGDLDLEVGLYLDILADLAEQRREKVSDAILSLCNKTPLRTRQGVPDCESISNLDTRNGSASLLVADCNASVASP